MKIFILLLTLGVCTTGCAFNALTADTQPKKNLDKDRAISFAQTCLAKSPHKNDYYQTRYYINEDSGEEQLWAIIFESKSNQDDCLYGALVYKDTGEISCRCLNQ